MSHSSIVRGPAIPPLTPASRRFLGKASFLFGDTAQAEASYRGAISLSRDALPAWKGLAEVYAGTRSVQPEALEIFEQLVRFTCQETGCSTCMLLSKSWDVIPLRCHAASAIRSSREQREARRLPRVLGKVLHCQQSLGRGSCAAPEPPAAYRASP